MRPHSQHYPKTDNIATDPYPGYQRIYHDPEARPAVTIISGQGHVKILLPIAQDGDFGGGLVLPVFIKTPLGDKIPYFLPLAKGLQSRGHCQPILGGDPLHIHVFQGIVSDTEGFVGPDGSGHLHGKGHPGKSDEDEYHAQMDNVTAVAPPVGQNHPHSRQGQEVAVSFISCGRPPVKLHQNGTQDEG